MPEATADFADTPQTAGCRRPPLAIQVLLRQRAVIAGIEAPIRGRRSSVCWLRKFPGKTVSDEIRRYYRGNPDHAFPGDLFQVRHILFDTRAETTRPRARARQPNCCSGSRHPDNSAAAARRASVCTSAEVGANSGQLSVRSVVPEFWSALVAFGRVGLLPQSGGKPFRPSSGPDRALHPRPGTAIPRGLSGRIHEVIWPVSRRQTLALPQYGLIARVSWRKSTGSIPAIKRSSRRAGTARMTAGSPFPVKGLSVA